MWNVSWSSATQVTQSWKEPLIFPILFLKLGYTFAAGGLQSQCFIRQLELQLQIKVFKTTAIILDWKMETFGN